MKGKKTAALIICAALFFGTLAAVHPGTSNAFFGIVTIEDLMEWFGINRTDRIKDIKDNILRTAELTYILPELVFKGGDLTSMIGKVAGLQIPDITKDFKDFEKELEELYDLPGSFLDGITGKAFPDTALGGILSRGNNAAKKADGISWDSYQEEPVAVLGGSDQAHVKETRIYKAVSDMIKESWDESESPSFEEFDPSMFEGASTAAYFGTLTMPKAHLREGMMKGAAQYGQDIKEGRIKKITELIAETEILASEIKKKITEKEKNITDDLGGDVSQFAKDGGAWKGTASMYASIARQNVDSQMLIADLQALLRLRLRMKAQVSSLMLYDYVNYCSDTLELRNASVRETDRGMSGGAR